MYTSLRQVRRPFWKGIPSEDFEHTDGWGGLGEVNGSTLGLSSREPPCMAHMHPGTGLLVSVS